MNKCRYGGIGRRAWFRLHHVGELAKIPNHLANVDQAVSSTSVLTSLPCKNSEGKNEYADMAE